MSGFHIIPPDNLRDPAEHGALDEAGRLQVLPASFWADFSQDEITVFCVKWGFYCVATSELVAYLKTIIEAFDGNAIEIGSGNGVLAEALGIRATDNRMQERSDIRRLYERAGQTPVRYGKNVEHLDALVAVKRYQPHLVLAAFVTHKYDPKAHFREGNMHGVEERQILKHAAYLFVGHEHTHQKKPILERPHDLIYPDWLVSRTRTPGRNFIAIWPKDKKK